MPKTANPVEQDLCHSLLSAAGQIEQLAKKLLSTPISSADKYVAERAQQSAQEYRNKAEFYLNYEFKT